MNNALAAFVGFLVLIVGFACMACTRELLFLDTEHPSEYFALKICPAAVCWFVLYWLIDALPELIARVG